MVDQSNDESATEKKQIPVQEGLFYQPQSPEEKPYLIGSKCTICGYISFPQTWFALAVSRRIPWKKYILAGRAK